MSTDELISLLMRRDEMSADDFIRVITELKMTIKPEPRGFWSVGWNGFFFKDRNMWVKQQTINGCLRVVLKDIEESKETA